MSIKRLIEPLGISTKTVYKYFKNKEELLEEVLHLYHAEQYQLLDNLSTDHKVVPLLFDIWYKAVEREYKVNKAFFLDLHYYYPELERKTEAVIGGKFRKRFLQIVKKGVKDGVLKENILPFVVLEGMSALYKAIERNGQFKKFHVSPYEILLNTIAIYIRGFCTQKGIRELDKHIIKKSETKKLVLL